MCGDENAIHLFDQSLTSLLSNSPFQCLALSLETQRRIDMMGEGGGGEQNFWHGLLMRRLAEETR